MSPDEPLRPNVISLNCETLVRLLALTLETLAEKTQTDTERIYIPVRFVSEDKE